MKFLLLFVISSIFCASSHCRVLRRHRKLKTSTNGQGITDQYVFRFNPTVNAKAKVQDLLAEYDNEIELVHTYNSVFKGACFGGIDEEILQEILADEDVIFVEQDELVRIDPDDEDDEEDSKDDKNINYDGSEVSESSAFVNLKSGTQYLPPNWGLDRIDQADLPLNNEYSFGNFTGSGVKVFVLDSGIRETHAEFNGRARCSRNLVADESCEDGRGHGTHVAASIGGVSYGVAKGVQIEAVKILGRSGATSYSNLIAGVNHVMFRRLRSFMDPRPFVMNMSVGGDKYLTLDIVASIAANMGIIVVSSAGNNGGDACNYSPGASWWVLTVGSTGKDDSRSYFSNYGECVNIFAPGDSIWSAGARSDSAFSIRSGTSMAAPLVAGVAALYIERYPKLRAGQIRRKILENAIGGVVQNPGPFSNNRLLQV